MKVRVKKAMILNGIRYSIGAELELKSENFDAFEPFCEKVEELKEIKEHIADTIEDVLNIPKTIIKKGKK